MSALPYIARQIIPAAMDMLPHKMDTPEARAMLLAIGLQESRFEHRKQVGGPARGFWQFEQGGGVRGVLRHNATYQLMGDTLIAMSYDDASAEACYAAITHNDILACIFARLLLYTLPQKLPGRHQPSEAWNQYADSWRPGKPHPETWEANFNEAWRNV